ncbi:hypothetical protein Tco_1360633 [Tanacetum coccineum]
MNKHRTFLGEIFKSLSFLSDRPCCPAILCLDQHVHTMHHLESLLQSPLDRLDIFEGCLSMSMWWIQRISLTGFPAQSVGSSNTNVLDLPCLLVLITRMSQSRQHVDTSLIHIESRKSPTTVLFDDDTGRISIRHFFLHNLFLYEVITEYGCAWYGVLHGGCLILLCDESAIQRNCIPPEVLLEYHGNGMNRIEKVFVKARTLRDTRSHVNAGLLWLLVVGDMR